MNKKMPDEEWALDKYLEEARAQSRALEDEPQVIELAASGDTEARQLLVKAYLSAAAEVGMRLARPGMTRLQAVQEANLVLTRLASQRGPTISTRLEAAIEDHFSRIQ